MNFHTRALQPLALLAACLVMPAASAAPMAGAGASHVVSGDRLWALGFGKTSALMADRSWAVLQPNGGIDSTGALWTWGSGNLGVGNLPSSVYPLRVGNESSWRSLFRGEYHSYAVKQDGSLWGWGHYYLYSTTVFNSSLPVQIGTDTNWRFVTGAGYHLAIRTDGSLWAWGHNGHGNLGTGDNLSSNVPIRVGSATDWQSASCAGWTSFGIKTDGSLWVWGGYSGIFGNGTASASSNVPIRVGADSNWLKISGNNQSVAGLRTDGSLWSWGAGFGGVLGLGSTANQLTPARIGTSIDWVDVAFGGSHVVAVRSGGSVWSWGTDLSQQFGLAGVSASDVPLDVSAAFIPKARFAIYQGTQSVTSTFNNWACPTAIRQEPTFLSIKVRNNGFAPLVLTGGSLAGFTVTYPPAVAALAEAAIQIRLDAVSSGQFWGTVPLQSNDPERANFNMALSGTVVSPESDTDADGMKDGAELALAGLGFLWNSNQTAMVSAFFENVGLTGLHHPEEVMDLQWQAGAPLADPFGQTLQIPLEITDPARPATPVLTPGSLPASATQHWDAAIPMPAGKRFLRLK